LSPRTFKDKNQCCRIPPVMKAAQLSAKSRMYGWMSASMAHDIRRTRSARLGQASVVPEPVPNKSTLLRLSAVGRGVQAHPSNRIAGIDLDPASNKSQRVSFEHRRPRPDRQNGGALKTKRPFKGGLYYLRLFGCQASLILKRRSSRWSPPA
jgi:hypothetical protein